MFLFPELARNILGQIITAEDKGKPIPLEVAVSWWGNCSTWEDLVDGGYVYRSRETGVTVTAIGRAYHDRPT